MIMSKNHKASKRLKCVTDRHESTRDLASIDRITFNLNEKQEEFRDTWLPFT